MDYREIIEILGCYKDEACKLAENRCDRCEAGQEYRGNPTCSFDTASRFIEWQGIYNKKNMIVNIKKLNNIRNNYPTIWKWMQDKASWEHITMGAVLNNYEEYIDELIRVIKQMNVDKLCKDCLNYHKCIEEGYVDQDGIPVKLKDRLYSLFVEGYDCFVRRFEDEE